MNIVSRQMKITFIHMNILLSHAQKYLLLLRETFLHLGQTSREMQETLRHMDLMLPQVNQTFRHLDQTSSNLYLVLRHLVWKRIHKEEGKRGWSKKINFLFEKSTHLV
jgi:hypothetical protein